MKKILNLANSVVMTVQSALIKLDVQNARKTIYITKGSVQPAALMA